MTGKPERARLDRRELARESAGDFVPADERLDVPAEAEDVAPVPVVGKVPRERRCVTTEERGRKALAPSPGRVVGVITHSAQGFASSRRERRGLVEKGVCIGDYRETEQSAYA